MTKLFTLVLKPLQLCGCEYGSSSLICRGSVSSFEYHCKNQGGATKIGHGAKFLLMSKTETLKLTLPYKTGGTRSMYLANCMVKKC